VIDKKKTFAPIESYAVIGDCETAALVGLDGSIDWLCWPEFSSDACFARLLGSEENGRWLLAPAAEGREDDAQVPRSHAHSGDDLRTAADFAVMLIDFMPIRGTNSDIVRIVKGIRGSAPMQMELSIRFNYGATVPWVTRSDGGIRAIAGPDLVVLRTKAPLAGEDLTTVSEFTVNEGESVDFVMTYGRSHLHAPRAIDVVQSDRRDADILGGMGRGLQLPGTVPGHSGAFADHAESSHLPADGWDRRRRNHLAAGAAGRSPQLGLSLLLAARRDVHFAGLHAWRVLPGGKRPGSSGCCAPSPAVPTRFRSCMALPVSAICRNAN
jgi:hypothetical protein